MCCSGRRNGVAGFTGNWQDKIPFDLYLCFSVTGIVLTVLGAAICVANVLYLEFDGGDRQLMFRLYLLAGLGALILYTALISTLATRCKTRTLLKNTVIWRVLAFLGRGVRGIGRWWGATFGSWSITRRVIVLFGGYLLISLLTTLTVLLALPWQAFVLFCLCRYLKQWLAIREGTVAIVGGRPDTVIDTAGMKHFPDLAEHAGQLNDLGSAINSAVEERMKSERMKSELITNVSHDLKTPLTSIINYVDLLKKEKIENEKAMEYIEVLDRKSQRLKRLTEDLVEASKASSGAMPVYAEVLDLVQLVDQACGEYREKLESCRLSLVTDLPLEPVRVLADGRHLWRVLDNLLNNCAKYALEGTRVYLSLERREGQAVMTMRNISREALSIPAEQLTERFVRGEESRTGEGSGLGLSIARSLTELQGGRFAVSVDGDLFKVEIFLREEGEQP